MKHSVIIPCYNSAALLAEQLEALSRQRYEAPWEVIVADNGSVDDVAAVVARFTGKLPNLRLIDASARPGSAFARNEGAKVARGEQLSFIDADDVAGEGWLAAIAQALERYDFVASRHDFTRLNPPAVLASRHNRQSEGLQPYTAPPYLPHAGGCGLGIKAWLHRAVGGFDESFRSLQDTDYCWRVQLAGHELHFVPEAVVHVRFRSNPSAIYRQALRFGEANVHLYKVYRSRGMPSLSWKHGVSGWLRLVRTLPALRDPQHRGHWIWDLGWRVGRLLGSLRYRTLAL